MQNDWREMKQEFYKGVEQMPDPVEDLKQTYRTAWMWAEYLSGDRDE